MPIGTDFTDSTVAATVHAARHNDTAAAVNALTDGTAAAHVETLEVDGATTLTGTVSVGGAMTAPALVPPVTIDSSGTSNTSLTLKCDTINPYLIRLINTVYGASIGPGIWLDDFGTFRLWYAGGGTQDALVVTAAGLVTGKAGLQTPGPTVGLGYATGAGGTVAQSSSKSTGVILNKVSGQVTMNNAALSAAAKVSFVVTNSTVTATDTVVVNVASGGTANAYRASVTAVASGSFTVTVENITAGSLSEAPVLNFAVLKAVAA